MKQSIDDQLLRKLRCPLDQTTLTLAGEELVGQLNAAIRAGWLVNQGRQQVERHLDGGLVRAAGDLLYPIVDQIPVLLADEAIELDQLDEAQ